MTGAVIRPTMTRAAQAAVLGGVCARAADGAASRNVMSSASQRSNLMVSLPHDLKKIYRSAERRSARLAHDELKGQNNFLAVLRSRIIQSGNQ